MARAAFTFTAVRRFAVVGLATAGFVALGSGMGTAASAADAVPPTGMHYEVTSTQPLPNGLRLAVSQTTHRVYTTRFEPTTGGDTAQVEVTDGVTGASVATIEIDSCLTPLTPVIDEASDTVYVPCFDSAEVVVIDGATDQVTTTIEQTDWHPYAGAVDPATHTLYVADGGQGPGTAAVAVIDTTTNTVENSVPIGDGLREPALDAAAHRLYVSVSPSALGDPGSIAVVDTTTNTLLTTILPAGAGGLDFAAVDASAHRMYTFDANTLYSVDTTTNEVTGAPVENLQSDPSAAAFDATAQRLYIAGSGSEDLDGVPGHEIIVAGLLIVDPATGTSADPVILEATSLLSLGVDEASGTVFAVAEALDGSLEQLTISLVPDPTPTPTPAPTDATVTPASLAATGATPALPLTIGGALLLAGAALWLVRRRVHAG
jgi:LPXTG-motif cell wall-anchored protein